MKKRIAVEIALLLVVGLLFAAEIPSLQEPLHLCGAVARLVIPPKGVNASFYFRKAQWRADLETLKAEFAYLRESGAKGSGKNKVGDNGAGSLTAGEPSGRQSVPQGS